MKIAKEPRQAKTKRKLILFHLVYLGGSPIFRKDRGSNTEKRRERREEKREREKRREEKRREEKRREKREKSINQ